MARMSRVLDGLFLNGVKSSLHAGLMQSNKITAVVRIDNDPAAIKKVDLDPAPVYHLVALGDTKEADLLTCIPKVNDFVHQIRLQGGRVLIHCQMGVSRSAGLLIAYLMSICKYGFSDILRVVTHARPVANPNEGFRRQLNAFRKVGPDEERKRLREKFPGPEFDALAAADNATLEQLIETIPGPLSVVTLNVWGSPLPFLSTPNQVLRVDEIGLHLSEEEYDVVALQDITESDFRRIKEKVSAVLPEAYYFQASLAGNGVCIFTKGKVEFPMSQRLTSSDSVRIGGRSGWTGGSIVGLVRVSLRSLTIDVYATQLLATCVHDEDLHMPRQILQAFELSQFIKRTQSG